MAPASEYVEPDLARSTIIPSAATSGQFSEIPIERYHEAAVPGLKKLQVELVEPVIPHFPSLKLTKGMNTLCPAALYALDLECCPLWNGFIRRALKLP